MRPVRCITFNIKGLTSGWFERRAQVVLETMARLRPDLLLLQEAALRSDAKLYHQAEQIGAMCGLEYCAFSPYGTLVDVMSTYQEGVATLSRWPMESVRTRRLPSGVETPPDARTMLYTRVRAPEGPIHVANLHLSWRPEEASIRLIQTGMVVDELFHCGALDHAAKAIVGGDFNAEEHELAIRLAGKRFKDAYRAFDSKSPGYTWVNSNPLVEGWTHMPDRRLDYLFCSKDASVQRSELILNGGGQSPGSDHYAVLADLNWHSGSAA